MVAGDRGEVDTVVPGRHGEGGVVERAAHEEPGQVDPVDLPGDGGEHLVDQVDPRRGGIDLKDCERPRCVAATAQGEVPSTVVHGPTESVCLKVEVVDGARREGLFVAAQVPAVLVHDDKRGLPAYTALQLRVADEVRDRRRINPYASLVRIGPQIGVVV